MSEDASQVDLCLVCLSPPSDRVNTHAPLPGSGRALYDVITELLTSRETRDRQMLSSVCGQCHRLLTDFDQASEQARGLRATIQSVFDGADRKLVAMLLEPRQSRAVLAAAAQSSPPHPAVHIEILQTSSGGEEADVQNSCNGLPAKQPELPPILLPPGVHLPPTEAGTPVLSADITDTNGQPSDAASTADITAEAISAAHITLDDIASEAAEPADVAAGSGGGSAGWHRPEAGSAAGRYRCSVCGQAFADKAQLLHHRRRRHGRGRRAAASLQCLTCRATLPSRAALTRHLRSHAETSGADRHVCGTCGKVFQRLATLRAHSMLHDERGLRCPYCPQKYTSRQDLEQHVARHTGARNCACPECGKTYRFRANLAHHIQTVHRQQKLACHLCGKTFNMQKKLNRHCNIVHGRLRYKCTICDSQFCYESQLRRHMKKSKHLSPSGHSDSVSGGKDRSLEAYIETVETGEDGTQMLTLVIDDRSGPGGGGDDGAGETLVLSVGEGFNDDVSAATLDGAGLGVRGDGAILEIIEEDDDSSVGNGDQIILRA